MLRSHHHLRGFIKLVLWDVYCVNGCWSSRLGYVGVGFEGNCDRRYGILYAPMLGGSYVGYSGISSFFLRSYKYHYFSHIIVVFLTEIYPSL